MKSKDATARFDQAKQLFAQRRYAESLALLDTLDAAYPNTKNILYPRALCLAMLGRVEDALKVAQQLVARHGDPRAARLVGRINAKQARALLRNAADVDDFIVPSRRPDWRTFAAWVHQHRVVLLSAACCVMVIALLAAVLF